MRTTRRLQMPLIAPRSAHARAQELAEVDRLLDDNPTLSAMVAADLVSRPGGGETGRPGLTGEQVLRASLVRSLEQCSYDVLEFHLSDSQTYRWFCRIGWGQGSPSASTLQENIRRVRPETWEAVNDALVALAIKVGAESGKKVRVDCTVTESNIHPPDDAGQLFDTVRVLVRLLQRAKKLREGVSVHGRTRRAKRRRMETMDAKEEPRRAAYRDLLRVTEEVLGWARAAVPLLRAGAVPGDEANILADELASFLALGQAVVDQTRARVFEKKKVASVDKVVSIFEPHTDIIIKKRREVLYGHKLLLTTGSTGLVLHADVLDGNPADSTLVGPAIDGVTRAVGFAPQQASLDGGFASREGLALARAKGVKDVCFSKRRGMKVEDMAKSPWVYRKLWRFRAGIEAGISWLKRCFGLDRARWKGENGFHAYVRSNIVAFNVLRLASLTAP
jgi:transposase, IS5 family